MKNDRNEINCGGSPCLTMNLRNHLLITSGNPFWYCCSRSRSNLPGPAVIKLFESENELKCKNQLRDFIETPCLFPNTWENSLRLFTLSAYKYNYLAKYILFSRKSYDKILENILKFYDGGPRMVMHGCLIMITFMRRKKTKHWHTWSGWPIVITWIHLKMPGTC